MNPNSTRTGAACARRRASPLSVGLMALLLTASLARAIDLGGLTKGLGNDKLTKALDTAKDAGKMLKGAAGVGPAEEQLIGDAVSLEIIARYGGLVRDADVMRRVNLVGRALARYSNRPQLEWKFAVLDSDTINAFSSPDGYVFVTRGLYERATSDDVLAAILSHEIAHITNRHALKIVSRADFFAGASAFAAKRSEEVRRVQSQLSQFDLGIEQITKTLFEKGFDPQTEYSADLDGRKLAVTTGYAPGGLRAVLLQLQSQGENRKTMFSTHPPVAERLKRLPEDPAPEAVPHDANPDDNVAETKPEDQ